MANLNPNKLVIISSLHSLNKNKLNNPIRRLCQPASGSITKCHRLGGLNNRNYFSTVLEARGCGKGDPGNQERIQEANSHT